MPTKAKRVCGGEPGRPAAVFLDRDGTVIHDRCYLSEAGGVELLPGVAAALARLAAAGYLLVVVTNQSGVGRGYFTRAAVGAQHRRLRRLLAAEGVRLAAIEVCPHTSEDGCRCRKPLPGMLLRAARRLGIDLARSYMVGDKASDVGAGRAAGCRTIAVGQPCPTADCAVPDLPAAAALILRRRPPV